MQEFHEGVASDPPDYVNENSNSQKLLLELVANLEAVLGDLESGTLIDTRPHALQSFRAWEDKLQRLM